MSTYGVPIGIGSNITAELCAILSAVVTTLQANLAPFNRVFIFSDCQTAIDLALNRCTPSHSFDLVSKIHVELECLRSKIPVSILWVPAHVGVPGNEAANTAAQKAANAVVSISPIPGQPLVPFSTSCAFIKRALKIRSQQQWFSIVAKKVGLDHLSRIRADVSAAPAFFVGTRQQQTILAKLRFGTCNLNFSKSRLNAHVNEECECGMAETVGHFLLRCPRYNRFRDEMRATIRPICSGTIDEDLLLGGGGVKFTPENWETIVASVANFVLSTKRSI